MMQQQPSDPSSMELGEVVREPSFNIELPNMVAPSNIQQIHVFLMMLADFCAQQAAIHSIAFARFRTYNFCFAIPAILLSTVAGAANLVNISNESCINQTENPTKTWIGILFGVMGLVAACLFSIHRFANIAELQQQHDYFSDEFEKMNLDIRSNILLDNTSTNRCFANLYEYLKFCKYELVILIDHAPALPNGIVRRFFKKKKAIEITHFLKS